MKLIKIKCENCGSMLEFNEELDKITCNYCGTVNIIDDEATKLKRIEEAKLKARKDNHEQDLKEKEDILNQEIELQKKKEELEEHNKFKNSKWPKRIIIMTILCVLCTWAVFNEGKILTGIIGIIQIGLFIAGYLMGMHYIKEKFNHLHTLLILSGFILIIPFLITNNSATKSKYSNKYCKGIDWDEIHYKDILVKIDDLEGYIISNSDSGIYIEVCDISKKEYKKYKEDMINKGFNYDDSYGENKYEAYNLDGYYLKLDYDDDDEQLRINLDAPKYTGEFSWPTSGVGSSIPKTKSNSGKILTNELDSFSVIVSKMSKSDFNNYIDECKNNGYNIDYNKLDTMYTAKNSDGNSINIRYIGGNQVSISVETKEKIEQDEIKAKEEKERREREAQEQKEKEERDKKEREEQQKQEQEQNNTSKEENKNTGIGKDFKKAMDSYEAFIDEYIRFMDKYNKNPSDLTLIQEYSNYITKLTEMESNFDKWKYEDLNNEEKKYYLEVETRVAKKLTDAASRY